jgi:colicin import membrane protein
MNSATSTTMGRDPFMPRPPKVRGRAITLAVLAHVLLILALAFGVNWRSSEPTTVAAELWSATPQAAAPRAVEPPPTPTPPVKKPEPTPKPVEPVAPPKPTPPAPDPQIAIEKAKRDEAKRVAAEQEQQQKARREKAEHDKAERAEAEREKRAKEEQALRKAAADKEKADKAEKAEAARQAAARDAYLKRMQGMVGATGGATDTGTALRSSAPSASYAGRIMARIKPNIVFTDVIDGNPMATVEVKLAPDGTIVAKRLVKSSGVKSWDDAVLRAIERTEVLPRDVDGRVPPPFQIDFRPRD